MELRDRISVILTILRKDLQAPLWSYIVVLVIATILGFLLTPVAFAMRPPGVPPPTFVWSDGTLRPFYAMSALLTSITLGLAFYSVHSDELRKGTIRTIILYPVDMNDITIAKLVASLVLALVFSTALFFGPLAPFFLAGAFPFPDFLAIHMMALFMGFLALATGVFLSHLVAHYAGRMVLSPTALGSLFLLLSGLLSEFAVEGIGTQLVWLSARSRGEFPGPADFAVVDAVGNVLSMFSPHHVGARVLSIAFGVFPRAWPDIQFVVPLAVLVLVAGFFVGKRLYLDVFIR